MICFVFLIFNWIYVFDWSNYVGFHIFVTVMCYLWHCFELYDSSLMLRLTNFTCSYCLLIAARLMIYEDFADIESLSNS